jgi:hypothetical protein
MEKVKYGPEKPMYRKIEKQVTIPHVYNEVTTHVSIFTQLQTNLQVFTLKK